jgi:acyl dehydratase
MAEIGLGAPKLNVADLRVGSMMPERRAGPITQEHLIRYAGASGDFNPFHYDAEMVRSRGFKGIFAQGLLTAGILGQTLAAWAGQDLIRKLGVRFAEPVWLGDELTFCAVVTQAYMSEAGNARADLDCTVSSGDGRQVLKGSAILGKAD